MMKRFLLYIAFFLSLVQASAQDMKLALVYNEYGDNCVDEGLYYEARNAYLRAYDSLPEDAGPTARPVICQKLSSVSRALADYTEALHYIDLAEQQMAETICDAPSVTSALKLTRAQLMREMGDPSGALMVVTEAMLEEMPDAPEHFAMAQLMADLYMECGLYGEALSVILMDILPSAAEPLDSLYAFESLVKAYSKVGKKNYADASLVLAEDVFKRNYPSDKVLKSGILDVKAYSAESFGNYAEAYAAYADEYEIISRLWGNDHPLVISCMYGMAKCALLFGNKDRAWEAYVDYLTNKKRYLSSEFFRMNSNDMSSYWHASNEGILDAPLFCHYSGRTTGEGFGDVLNAVMFAKSATLDLSMSFADLVERSADSTVAESYRRVRDSRARMCELMGIQDTDAYLEMDSLKTVADALEKEIRFRMHSEGLLRDTLDFVDWKQVASVMGERTVAIEFADFQDGAARRYCAFVYDRNSEAPDYVPLCTEDELIAVWGAKTENFKRQYELIWKPLEKYLSAESEVCFAPSRFLNDIPMEYLMAPDGRLAVEMCGSMRRMNVTKEISSMSARQGFDRLCVYADIYYGEADDSRSTASRFPMLKGSRFELAAIKSSLGRKIPLRERSLKKATESDFRRLEFDPAARTIVHFSTHGFYFTVDEAPLYPYYSRYDVGNLIRYPLLRCGLAMAGADLVWVGAVTPESDRNDGILTAQEISEMDLRGVSLVVLAACQTGLGDISSEGVMGMQRAFRLAGVESMMVSLWPTNDNATAVLMAGFYAAMAAGMDAHEALRESVLALKNTPGMEDPYYWAPFIIVE